MVNRKLHSGPSKNSYVQKFRSSKNQTTRPPSKRAGGYMKVSIEAVNFDISSVFVKEFARFPEQLILNEMLGEAKALRLIV
jgi:hypothetical protein